MARVRVAVIGSIGKSILIDTDLAPRLAVLETAVEALQSTGVSAHRNLSGLQIGDDHPQYTMWQAPEQIQAAWNFVAEPSINGDLLTEFIQDKIGTILVDSANIDFTYSDATPSITATVIYANPSGLVGMSAVNGTSNFSTRSDARHAIDPAIAPTWTGVHTFGNDWYRDSPAGTTREFGFDSGGLQRWLFRCTSQAEAGANAGSNFQWLARNDAGGALFTVMSLIRSTGEVRFEAGKVWLDLDNQELQLGAGTAGVGDLRLYHDGTNSIIRNDTGNLRFQNGASVVMEIASTGIITSSRGHEFTSAVDIPLTIRTTAPLFALFETDQAAGARRWGFQANGGKAFFYAGDDADTVAANVWEATRTAGAVSALTFGNATDNTAFTFLGTGNLKFGGSTTGAQTATFIATNKPGAGTAGPIAWIPVLTSGGTQGYVPVFGA